MKPDSLCLGIIFAAISVLLKKTKYSFLNFNYDLFLYDWFFIIIFIQCYLLKLNFAGNEVR